MNQDTFSFVIYMIHACSNRWHLPPSEVYQKMTRADCINSYLVAHYDVLHTLGTGYLVDDVREYLERRGISV